MSLAQRIPPDFPLPDSLAWLRPEPGRPEAMPVRIVQHDRRDGTVRVSQIGPVAYDHRASAFRRVELTELAATEDEALAPPRKSRPRRTRSPRKGA